MSSRASTERFGALVEDYDRYRPTYPAEAMNYLAAQLGDPQTTTLADIGSGTGISSLPLVERGFTLYGVEPNEKMRAAAEERFHGNPRFHSVDGGAEETNLQPASVHHVVAAQAFHWFDKPRAQREFARIMKPGGKVAILFNERLIDASPFLRGFEDLLLKHSIDYAQVNHANLQRGVFDKFYETYTLATFLNEQVVDLDGMLGRVRSCSYVPHPGDHGWRALEEEMTQLFHTHQQRGHVSIIHDTQVYMGTLPNGH